jgi:ferredoxin
VNASVDPEKCQGHLRCALYAPEVFEVDEWGHSFVTMATIPPHFEDGTRKAAANCPESAITIAE